MFEFGLNKKNISNLKFSIAVIDYFSDKNVINDLKYS